MTPTQATLAGALQSRGRRRLSVADVRALWRQTDPIAALADDAHARFRAALAALDDAGVIELPVSASAWDRSVLPWLPRNVTVVAVPSKRSRPATPVTAWVPELQFAASERHPATLEALHAVNHWLKRNRGLSLPIVPITERSLEIFGDEKRFDGLRDGDALFGGRLRLSDLACRRLPPLLLWHPGRSTAETVLVVENAAAFESFRRFNEQAGLWRAVVWGAGNAFRRNHAGLGDIFAATGATQAVYFGDLDPKGIEILAGVVQERPGDLKPHRGLYAALTARRLARKEPGVAIAADRWGETLRALLPDLTEAILTLWRDGMVLPQEGYGFQALMDNPEPAKEIKG